MRATALAPMGCAGLILISALASAETAPPVRRDPGEAANPRVGRLDPAYPREASSPRTGPLRGIRSYGKGGVRVDRPGTVKDRYAEAGSTHESAPSPGVADPWKISGATMAGSVSTFAVSPDGTTAVFIADKDTSGRFELYCAPVNGSAAPTKISAGLSFGSGDDGVSAFQITPDSLQVVFLADPNAGGGTNDIFSVPINGSAGPVQLNGGAEAPITGLGITPDSGFAVFFGVDTSFGVNSVEVYSAPIGSASSAVQISDVGQSNSQGDVVAAEFSPDSARVVYAGDGGDDNVFQWHSVPTDAAAPGLDIQLSAAIKSVGLIDISPDSSRIAYTGDENSQWTMELFSIGIDGGARVQLNPAMAGAGVFAVEISPDGDWVGYIAEQDTAGVSEVYSAGMLTAGSGTKLNAPLAGAQFADSLNISSDSTTVLYEADQTTADTHELFRAPIDAGAGPSMLHGVAPPDDVGFFEGLGTPTIDGRAVYPVIGATVDLFSVPFDGSGPFTQISSPVAGGDMVRNVFLPKLATRLMAYGAGSATGSVTRELLSVAIRADLPPEQFNLTAGSSDLGALRYEITSDQNYGVYLQDQDTSGKPELYSRELDSDADTVPNPTDNCPFVVNPSQGSMLFELTVLASSDTTFTWGEPTDVRFVRGPLDMVDELATDDAGVLADTAVHIDAAVPAPGAGWYYLFALDCAGRSYQTELGAEPARDLASFP